MSLTVVVIIEVLQESQQEIRVNREVLQEIEKSLAHATAMIEILKLIVEVEAQIDIKRIILPDLIPNGREFLDKNAVFQEVKVDQNQKNTHQLAQKQNSLKNQIPLLDLSEL